MKIVYLHGHKLTTMTQAEIQQQIEVIRRASLEAGKSPETARQFLVDAGIIREPYQKEGQSLPDQKKK